MPDNFETKFLDHLLCSNSAGIISLVSKGIIVTKRIHLFMDRKHCQEKNTIKVIKHCGTQSNPLHL